MALKVEAFEGRVWLGDGQAGLQAFRQCLLGPLGRWSCAEAIPAASRACSRSASKQRWAGRVAAVGWTGGYMTLDAQLSGSWGSSEAEPPAAAPNQTDPARGLAARHTAYACMDCTCRDMRAGGEPVQ